MYPTNIIEHDGDGGDQIRGDTVGYGRKVGNDVMGNKVFPKLQHL